MRSISLVLNSVIICSSRHNYPFASLPFPELQEGFFEGGKFLGKMRFKAM